MPAFKCPNCRQTSQIEVVNNCFSCPNCGQDYEVFTASDGSRKVRKADPIIFAPDLSDSHASAQQTPYQVGDIPPTPNYGHNAGATTPAQSKSNKTWVIILIIALLGVMCICCISSTLSYLGNSVQSQLDAISQNTITLPEDNWGYEIYQNPNFVPPSKLR